MLEGQGRKQNPTAHLQWRADWFSQFGMESTLGVRGGLRAKLQPWFYGLNTLQTTFTVHREGP